MFHFFSREICRRAFQVGRGSCSLWQRYAAALAYKVTLSLEKAPSVRRSLFACAVKLVITFPVQDGSTGRAGGGGCFNMAARTFSSPTSPIFYIFSCARLFVIKRLII